MLEKDLSVLEPLYLDRLLAMEPLRAVGTASEDGGIVQNNARPLGQLFQKLLLRFRLCFERRVAL